MKPADIAALRRQVRELTGRWRAENRYVPRNDSWLRGFDLTFSRELAALGLIGLTWPVSCGGRGLPNVARAAVTEELLRAGAPVAAHWIGDRQIGPSILRHGSERLRAEILPGIISADYVFCLGMSEPEAGSDLASVRTFAARDGDGWRVRGRKIWTSGAHRATHAYLLARTERAADRHEGLTEFIVDMDSPGITVSPILDLTGEHHFNEVVFDDVPVPGHRVLGQVGDGWRQVVEQLSFERGGPERFLSSYTLLCELLEAAGGGAVDIRAGLGAEIGELTARLATLRRITWQVATRLDAGEAPVVEAATLKYLGNAFETDVVEVSRRAFGAGAGRAGFREALLASPGFSLRGGAAEVMLSVMARQETAGRGGTGRAAGAGQAVGAGRAGGELDDLIADIAARHAEPPPGELPACWETLVELGLPLVGVAEDRGGSGGSLADLAMLVRALGRHAISTPLIENAVANWVLAGARGDVAPGLRTISLDAPAGVGWARHADQLVLYRGDVALLADVAGLAIEPGGNLAGEPWDAVELDEGALTVLGPAPPAAEVRARLGLLRAAALTGAVSGAYELTREHLSTREQFGRPLVRIPAVAANLARIRAALIQCDAALDRAMIGAAEPLAGDRPSVAAGDWMAAVAAARVITGRAATETARLAHQLHGAIGVTAEYPLHRFTRRLWAWRDADATEHDWSVLLGERAAGGSEVLFWDQLTAWA
ncbi:MAG TPA: acyl-CoA dehydrogenase family protein [Streptosporangiaceae bacterium]|nr:acyl-CoA dehydrogenase family protein [Streptosporangiaceae bacterium]